MEFLPNPIQKRSGNAPQWAKIEEGDYLKILSYDASYRKEPILQVINSKHWVTLNRYDSRVLNSHTLFMADYDTEWGMYAEKQFPYTLESMRNLADEHNYRFEVYKTYGGYRILETSREHYLSYPKPRSEFSTADLLHMLCNDRDYIKLCKVQECFRHRLDTKPWREVCGDESAVATDHFVIGKAERCEALVPLLEAYDQTILSEVTED